MTVDLHEELKKQKKIAMIWGIDDVLAVRDDLNDDQCWQVLQRIENRADCTQGITWDTIDMYCDELFPKSDEEDGETTVPKGWVV